MFICIISVGFVLIVAGLLITILNYEGIRSGMPFLMAGMLVFLLAFGFKAYSLSISDIPTKEEVIQEIKENDITCYLNGQEIDINTINPDTHTFKLSEDHSIAYIEDIPKRSSSSWFFIPVWID